MAQAKDKIFGLVGRKLGHSYSPLIHGALGNPDYRLFELEPEELAGFLQNNAIGGLNVTIPYKLDVMQHCAVLSAQAKEIGSVNTIVEREIGLFGHNTDAYGLEYMAKRAKLNFTGKKVVVFGSGGASKTARHVSAQLGAAQVVVVSRKGEDNYDNLPRHFDADILINATPVGMYPNAGESVANLADFPKCIGVLDMVYNPPRTMLLSMAEERGIPHSGGLPMLVAQAKAAAELFFGREIPDSENERIIGLIRVQTENIVLIGMPGSGKTTVGAALGRLTGREVIDVDTMVEQAAGMPIPEMFAKYGEPEFRRIEREQTARCCAQSGKVITTGGGVVKDGRNYLPLRQNSRVYHIQRDIALLAREGRPLSMTTDLETLFAERAPLYERFRDATADNSGTPEQTAQAIWQDFCANAQEDFS